MSTLEERKARYEASALSVLMAAEGHEICPNCYCCDFVWQQEPCWACGGFEDEDDDWSSPCSECGGGGEIEFQVCIGHCDKNGEHPGKPLS